jgi:hypothetical protein
MSFYLLLELLEPNNKAVEESRPFIDKICKLLFRQEGAYSSGKHYGIINAESTLEDKNGNMLKLSFDNSNSQFEYELNSLTPLGIEKDSDVVKELLRMYDEHSVSSKAKLKFVSKGNASVLRGVNFGKVVNEKILRMVQDMLVMLSHDFKRK